MLRCPWLRANSSMAGAAVAETQILGVDFSGAGRDTDVGKTWVTKGKLAGQRLTVEWCCAKSRADLEKLLLQMPLGSVAAMDFPFGVPKEFANRLEPTADKMPCLWEEVSLIRELQQFKAAANEWAELLRVGDLKYPNAQPCLHLGRPVMVNMTFEGMKLLHRLWQTGRFEVPPLASRQPSQRLPVLLEVMPGAALKVFNLPTTRYKDGKDETQRRDRRKTRSDILKGLSDASGVGLEILDSIRDKCIQDRGGDAIDSLVATVVGARWALSKSNFLVPTCELVTTLRRKPRHRRQASPQILDQGLTELQAARLEGWIYAPRPEPLS